MKKAVELLDKLYTIDEEYNAYDEEGLMTPDSICFWNKHTEELKWIEEVIEFLKEMK